MIILVILTQWKRLFGIQQGCEKTLYNLGENKIVETPEKAMKIFIQREFPELEKLNKDGHSHDVLFIPDSFLYKELTEKVSTDYLSNYFFTF